MKKIIISLGVIVALAAILDYSGLMQFKGKVVNEAELPVYDMVIKGGRVIDPETGLDAVRNVGIAKGTIVAVSSDDMKGTTVIDATGQVVAPGFIDLHAHGQNNFAQTYQARDGVTTALELEGGSHDFVKSNAKRTGKSLINYGYSAGHGDIRNLVKDNDPKRGEHEIATAEELAEILRLVEEDIDNGAIGIGLPLDYMSRGVSDAELEGLFRISAKRDMPLFIHIRMPDDGADPSGFAELVDMTRKTGGSMHMVHAASTGLGRVPLYMKMMDDAQAEGLDITTEVYPYTAGSTGINSGIFDHDWQKKFGVSYGAIEWPPTGERFTGKEMWDEYRAKYPDGVIIIHVMTEENVEAAMAHPGVMIGSDGMRLSSLEQRAHPRGMGTFSRVLGEYSRKRGVLTLADAVSKMTYLPAKRLQDFTPAMAKKGRVQVGMDADITIFNPDTVIDNATYGEPNQYSTGINHVIVGGVHLVKDAALVAETFPGRPITTK